MNQNAQPGLRKLDAFKNDNQPVVMIVHGTVLDLERLMIYSRAIEQSGLYTQLGGYYLNDPRPVEVFEGDPAPGASILCVRFPCLAHARAFWYSQTYQSSLKPLRLNPPAGEFTVAVYAERDVPDALARWVDPGGYRPDHNTDVLESLTLTEAFESSSADSDI